MDFHCFFPPASKSAANENISPASLKLTCGIGLALVPSKIGVRGSATPALQ